jgi:hypothetical protein
MTRFMVIHKLPAAATQDEVLAAVRAVVNGFPKDTQWLRCWVAQKGDALFCEWESPEETDLWAVLKKGADLFPVEAVYPVTVIDPDWFDG